MAGEASLSTTFPWFAFLTWVTPHPSSYLPLSSLCNTVVLILCAETLLKYWNLYFWSSSRYTQINVLFSGYRTSAFWSSWFKDRCLLSWHLQYHIIPHILRRCHGIISGSDPLECKFWSWDYAFAALSTLHVPLSEWVETGGPSTRKAVWLGLPTPKWNVKRWKSKSLCGHYHHYKKT